MIGCISACCLWAFLSFFCSYSLFFLSLNSWNKYGCLSSISTSAIIATYCANHFEGHPNNQTNFVAVPLNSTILFCDIGTNSFKWSGASKCFPWVMSAAGIDAGADVYENSLLDDTKKVFRKISEVNKLIKGINIILL